MCTSAFLTTARVFLPPGPHFSRKGQTKVLRAFIQARSITQFELAAFIDKFGTGPDGRTERYDGTRDDGLIELERSIPGIRTHNELLQEACVFAFEMEKHFERITEVSVH